jgi:hypothetical protein
VISRDPDSLKLHRAVPLSAPRAPRASQQTNSWSFPVAVLSIWQALNFGSYGHRLAAAGHRLAARQLQSKQLEQPQLQSICLPCSSHTVNNGELLFGPLHYTVPGVRELLLTGACCCVSCRPRHSRTWRAPASCWQHCCSVRPSVHIQTPSACCC